jgi:hypothetical protein
LLAGLVAFAHLVELPNRLLKKLTVLQLQPLQILAKWFSQILPF